MDEFKIGGTVTIDENEKYIIVDIIKLDNETYYFSSSKKKPITPKIFKRIDDGKNTFIEFIENPKIVKMVLQKVIKG